MALQVVILAAGMGTRLGRPHPKPLTPLKPGHTILGHQLENVRTVFGRDVEILVVVGYKLEQILEAAPDVSFAYNELYDQTNTSKSLLRALRCTGDRPVLWMNGDVVFHRDVLRRAVPLIEADQSFVCVDTASVGDEEVKYRLDDSGRVVELSKSVQSGAGEAVGINFVGARDKAVLTARLAEVKEQDYFERGLELAIANDDMDVRPLDISSLFAVEIDFASDLDRANECL